jgi:hypothetical protein
MENLGHRSCHCKKGKSRSVSQPFAAPRRLRTIFFYIPIFEIDTDFYFGLNVRKRTFSPIIVGEVRRDSATISAKSMNISVGRTPDWAGCRTRTTGWRAPVGPLGWAPGEQDRSTRLPPAGSFVISDDGLAREAILAHRGVAAASRDSRGGAANLQPPGGGPSLGALPAEALLNANLAAL